jgi:hypothetical protein
MKNDEPKQNENQPPVQMLRFVRIRGGTVAFSCCQILGFF